VRQTRTLSCPAAIIPASSGSAPSGCRVTEEEYTLLYGPVLSRLFFERRDVTGDFIRDIVARWCDVGAEAQDPD
jgi:hypothetical protein